MRYMAQGTVRRIVNISAAEMDKLVDVALRAFEHEVSINILVGGHRRLRPLYFRSVIRAGCLEGELYVVENRNEIVTFGIWFPPGKSLFESEEQRRLGFDEFMESVDDDTRQCYAMLTEISNRWHTTWLPKPFHDIWWLTMLATDPPHRGKGHPTLLMQHAIDMITAPNVFGLSSISEETSHFYENAGIPFRNHLTPDVPTKYGVAIAFGHYREIML